MSKCRQKLREVRDVAHRRTGREGPSWDLNRGLLLLRATLSPAHTTPAATRPFHAAAFDLHVPLGCRGMFPI